MITNKITAPMESLEWVDRRILIPNDYNPNKVSRRNLELLTTSIFVNGFTLPIVRRPDNVIIDGFHRYTVFGEEWTFIPNFSDELWKLLGYDTTRKTLYERTEGMVPVVTVSQQNNDMYVYGTITHNRARGTHLLEPMKKIVQELLKNGNSVDEIGKQLGMKPEEIFRLSDFSKEDFLNMMAKGVTGFSKAEYVTKI